MNFSEQLLEWYDRTGRQLPWRGQTDPYCVWVSEIMLQQTRAEAVIPRYTAFLREFPDVAALAGAEESRVLKAWEGLGYYSRARNLHRAAKCVSQMGGAFPSTAEELKKLPGVGAYTAGAVASIAFGECVPALDGNQARVLARVLAWEKTLTRPDELAAEAEKHMPCTRPGDYNQALMDLGALVCTPVRPKCDACPVASLCRARAEGDPMDYPRKRPPVSRREVELTVHLVRAPGGILVRQRPRAGLLGGLWEFPNSEGDARFPDARFIGALPQAKHVFTHLVWRMQGALYRIESVPEGLRAVDLRALDALAMPSAFRVYRDIAREILAKEEKEAAES